MTLDVMEESLFALPCFPFNRLGQGVRLGLCLLACACWRVRACLCLRACACLLALALGGLFLTLAFWARTHSGGLFDLGRCFRPWGAFFSTLEGFLGDLEFFVRLLPCACFLVLACSCLRARASLLVLSCLCGLASLRLHACACLRVPVLASLCLLPCACSLVLACFGLLACACLLCLPVLASLFFDLGGLFFDLGVFGADALRRLFFDLGREASP